MNFSNPSPSLQNITTFPQEISFQFSPIGNSTNPSTNPTMTSSTMTYQTITLNSPPPPPPPIQIKIPFPPPLHDKDLIPKLKKGKMPLRTTNQFLLYRTALINTLHNIGYEEYNMRNISKMASELWKLEPNYVQEEYKKLANKVKRIYQDMEIKNIDINRIENCHENENSRDIDKDKNENRNDNRDNINNSNSNNNGKDDDVDNNNSNNENYPKKPIFNTKEISINLKEHKEISEESHYLSRLSNLSYPNYFLIDDNNNYYYNSSIYDLSSPTTSLTSPTTPTPCTPSSSSPSSSLPTTSSLTPISIDALNAQNNLIMEFDQGNNNNSQYNQYNQYSYNHLSLDPRSYSHCYNSSSPPPPPPPPPPLVHSSNPDHNNHHVNRQYNNPDPHNPSNNNNNYYYYMINSGFQFNDYQY